MKGWQFVYRSSGPSWLLGRIDSWGSQQPGVPVPRHHTLKVIPEIPDFMENKWWNSELGVLENRTEFPGTLLGATFDSYQWRVVISAGSEEAVWQGLPPCTFTITEAGVGTESVEVSSGGEFRFSADNPGTYQIQAENARHEEANYQVSVI